MSTLNSQRASYNRPQVHIGHTVSKQSLVDRITTTLEQAARYSTRTALSPTDEVLLQQAMGQLTKARRSLRIMLAK